MEGLAPESPVDVVADEGGLARIRGETLTKLPKDLYIPPDALEVVLESFEGPLDLLLYLIKRQGLDILDIPIAEVTRQYMEYIRLMNDMRLELAGEYLVMAATLAEIKSRLLLPKPANVDEEEDPRAELVRRLQAYEQFKKASENLDEIPRLERDNYTVAVNAPPEAKPIRRWQQVSLEQLVKAASEVLARAEYRVQHRITREPLSVRERMTGILERLGRLENGSDRLSFFGLLDPAEGRQGVVVTLLALLDLIKRQLIELVQEEAFGPIFLQMRGRVEVDAEAPHSQIMN